MFKTALASRTDTVKYEVTQKSSVEHVEVSQSNTKYFNFGISFLPFNFRFLENTRTSLRSYMALDMKFCSVFSNIVFMITFCKLFSMIKISINEF